MRARLFRSPFGRPWLASAAAIACLALAALALQREALVGGAIAYERDTQLFYAPLARWAAEQLRAGRLPLWLPNIFTGYPIFADGETGLAYPIQIIALRLLPFEIAVAWLRALHTLIAAVGMFWLLRTLRLDVISATGGGLVFALGSFLSVQQQHENVVRSAVWLPLLVALLERALQAATTRRRVGWVALGALAFGTSALGVHVQPVLMEALALVAWCLFRVGLGPLPRLPRAAGWRRWVPPWLLALAGIGLGGLLLAAVQWGPLAEWALVSFRRGGVEYEFASAFALAPQNLVPTLLFPFFFRAADGATWWSLWQPWETELYVGVPTLALALVGLVWSRRREAVFFVLLLLFSVWVAMAHYAPGPNLHQVLWSLPGFSFLRAPGRFAYLAVFSFAGLAALGLQAIQDRRAWLNRVGVALVGALPAVALLAALLALLPAWRTSLLADPERAAETIRSGYLSLRSQATIDPRVAYEGLLWSLDFANPKTAWGLTLLASTSALFVGGLALGPKRVALARAGFLVLLAMDLLTFGLDFDPRAPLNDLLPAPITGIPAGSRVLVHDSRSLPELEPNTLFGAGYTSVEGYSSLPSQRQVEVYDLTSRQPGLLDLWGAQYVIEPRQPTDLSTASNGVSYRFTAPLAGGFRGAAPVTLAAGTGSARVVAVRIVSTLSYGFEVPQGTTVGTLTLRTPGETALPIRAGIETAERAADRPSLQGLVRHSKPPGPTAADFDEWAPTGEGYQAHLYQAEISLGQPTPVQQVAMQPTDPTALLQVFGVGLVLEDGSVRSLGFADRTDFTPVAGAETARYTVLQARDPLPRAFVLPRERALYRSERPTETPAGIMAGSTELGPFNVRTDVLIEGVDGSGAARATAPAPPPQPATVEEQGTDRLVIQARADAPSYLVVTDFYHRGWRAFVDGQEAPVLIADGVYRAVPLEAGTHTVEMRFEPVSQVAGAAISAIALLAIAASVAWAFLVGPRRSMP